MSTTTTRPPSTDPSEVVRRTMIAYRREGCRLAAMILLADAGRIGDEAIGDFLTRVEYLKRETVSEWLRRAGVNPWRPASKLTVRERRMIAAQLVAYSKEQS